MGIDEGTAAAPPTAKDRLEKTWAEKDEPWPRGWHIIWVVTATVIVMTPAAVSAVAGSRSTADRDEARLWATFGALTVATGLGMLLYLNMRAQIAKKFPIRAACWRANFTSVPATLLHSLLFMVVLVEPSGSSSG